MSKFDELIDSGEAKIKHKDNKGAIADLNMAIELNPESAFAYFLRGTAKHNIGDSKGGRLDWIKVRELGAMEVYEMIKKRL